MTPLISLILFLVLVVLITLGLVYLCFKNKKYQNSKHKTKNKEAKNNFLKPLPIIFTKKNNNKNESFEKQFDLNSYKFPDGFIDFCNSNKIYSLDEDELNLYPIKFTKILERAEMLIDGCNIFDIPPHCIPFCDDESAGHVIYCLDYNLCGKQGAPRIISIDNESIVWGDKEGNPYKSVDDYNFREKIIANSFEEFLNKLKVVK